MKCKDFDRSVTELVRVGAPPAIRSSMEAHAKACGRCRARLDAERELGRRLAEMARSAAPLVAPAHVEQALRMAFREQHQASGPAPARFSLGWRARFALAAAAAGAVVAVSFWVSTNRVTTRPEPAPTTIAQDPAREPVAESPAPDRSATLPRVETQRLPPEEETERASRPANPPRHKEPPAALSADRDQDPAAPIAAVVPPIREITTDFLPLVYGGDLSGQGLQLVRVRLPRDALGYFGLPAHGFSGERIPADVLLGEDGTARAVRFVRYAREGTQNREGSGF